jgi:hypothetical protein
LSTTKHTQIIPRMMKDGKELKKENLTRNDKTTNNLAWV